MNKEDRMDDLIKEILKEDVEDVQISNSEIEFEWRKLQGLEKSKKENKKSYKRIASIAAIITISLMMINSFSSTQSYSWKIFKTKDIDEKTEGSISIEEQSSSQELKEYDETDDSSIEINNIEEASNFIDFDFRELPYKLEEAMVENEYTIILNYVNEKGNIEFIQNLEGDESSEVITVAKDSTIEFFKIRNTDYTLININNRKFKIMWSSFGVKYCITTNYSISKEEAINIIKSLK
ncbi:DUF4367 domain-containing protein [Tepidibacter aestuarii]|uniref:DUF4367 domain-containing protein n=1 Tax=Tepidibacter aestuarii TaxID=2925782 RepID=UPI0020BF132A|nr:DUF4367 domain-containing protein [Tepidibacter aestuarii]CAH2215083.1 conserved protein of unknown function [Tepidibacter aestuarii]